MNREIGKRIKHLRLTRNMTQETLARQLHVTRQNISSWETGKSAVSVEYLAALSSLFGVSVEELIYGLPPTNPYRKFQRRYLISLGIFAAALLIALASRPVVLSYLQKIQSTTFHTLPGLLYGLSHWFACFFFIGLTVCALVSLWGDLRLQPPIKSAALAGSIALVSAAVLLTVLVVILYYDPQSPLWTHSFVRFLYKLWLSSKTTCVLGFLSAILGFLGVNK